MPPPLRHRPALAGCPCVCRVVPPRPSALRGRSRQQPPPQRSPRNGRTRAGSRAAPRDISPLSPALLHGGASRGARRRGGAVRVTWAGRRRRGGGRGGEGGESRDAGGPERSEEELRRRHFPAAPSVCPLSPAERKARRGRGRRLGEGGGRRRGPCSGDRSVPEGGAGAACGTAG